MKLLKCSRLPKCSCPVILLKALLRMVRSLVHCVNGHRDGMRSQVETLTMYLAFGKCWQLL